MADHVRRQRFQGETAMELPGRPDRRGRGRDQIASVDDVAVQELIPTRVQLDPAVVLDRLAVEPAGRAVTPREQRVLVRRRLVQGEADGGKRGNPLGAVVGGDDDVDVGHRAGVRRRPHAVDEGRSLHGNGVHIVARQCVEHHDGELAEALHPVAHLALLLADVSDDLVTGSSTGVGGAEVAEQGGQPSGQAGAGERRRRERRQRCRLAPKAGEHHVEEEALMRAQLRGDRTTLAIVGSTDRRDLIVRVVMVVPGGVDPPGSPRTIPFIHHLVESVSSEHRLRVIAIGHDPEPGEWRLFDAEVVNVPIGRHSRADVARAVADAVAAAGRGGRPDVVHGLWANVTGLAAVAIAHRYRVGSVVSVCGGELAALPDIGYGGARRRGTRLLASTTMRAATVTTAATAWMRDQVAAAGHRIDELIPLGADLRVFAPTPTGRSAGDRSAARLVHVGSLNRVKDQELLLRGFARVVAIEPAMRLDVIGIDTMAGEHRRLAARLGIADAVQFHGLLPAADVAALIRTAVLHVNTSRHEAGPVAVLEAAACGVPTVGTAVGHVADLASMPVPAAVTIRPRDPAAFAEAVLGLIEDDALRGRLGNRALQWASVHDATFTSRSFEVLYRRLTARS